MTNLHNILGTLVVLAFLGLTVINVLRVTGRPVAVAAPLSYAAAALLVIQIVIGFALLGGGLDVTPLHYVLALLAIVTVALEHGYARAQSAPELRAMVSLLATGATTILVTAAHIIGSSN
ncbi:MAG: hypothetical protein M3464_16005 [Chloroflexota bacterium]|nr:hypothetical protein [Chloroflexota bacterium]